MTPQRQYYCNPVAIDDSNNDHAEGSGHGGMARDDGSDSDGGDDASERASSSECRRAPDLIHAQDARAHQRLFLFLCAFV